MHQRQWKTRLARAVVASIVLVPVSAGDRASATSPAILWHHLGGDRVVGLPIAAESGASAAAACGGEGYTLFDCERALDSSYRITLVRSGDGDGDGVDDAEEYRSTVQSIAGELGQVTGTSFAVAPGLLDVPDKRNLDPGRREVQFVVHGDAPCGPGFAGCGGPSGDERSAVSEVSYLDGGAVWIYPVAVNYSADSKRHLAAHELGHAVGLDHHDQLLNGQAQVMHSSSYDATGYRAGDRSGLRRERQNGEAEFVGWASLLRRFSGSHPIERSGDYRPFTGNFDGDSADDVFWYTNGQGYDNVVYGQGNRTFWPTTDVTIGGGFTPVAGDFNGDGSDDVFWFGYGTAADLIWWGNGDRTFTQGPSLEAGGLYRPFSGDFDGDGFDDLFLYAPGSERDYIYFGSLLTRSSGPWTSTCLCSGDGISGDYVPLAGDFNGDRFDDVFWYTVSGGGDFVWWGSPLSRVGTFTSSSAENTGIYQPVVGNFDADLADDIFWYTTDGQYDHIAWGVPGANRFLSTDVTVPDMPFTHVSGDFDGDLMFDLLGYRAG